MSRIIRSRDTQPAGVTAVCLDKDPTPPAHPNRPDGGLLWVSRERVHVARAQSEFARQQAEAECILDRARSEAERIQQEAYHAGFARGEAAGAKLAAQKVEPVLQSLKTLIEAVGAERRTLIEQNKAELIRIAFLIATQVVHHEVETNNETILHVAEAALAKAVKADRVQVKVSPYDLEVIQQAAAAEAPPEWIPSNVELEGDFNMGRGGCKIVTDTGEIDASIETQLRLLRAVLWNE